MTHARAIHCGRSDWPLGHRQHHFSLAIVIGLAFVSNLAHSANNVIEVSAKLSKLAYDITELDETDGVSPGISFNPGEYDGTMISLMEGDIHSFVTNYEQNTVQGSVFSSADKEIGNLDSMASKSGTTLSTSASYSSMEAQSLLTAPYQPTPSMGQSALFYKRSAEAWVNGSFGGMTGLAFTLAPNTSVTFSGEVDLSSAMNLLSLANSEAFAKAKSNHASLTIFGYGLGEIGVQHPFVFLNNVPLPSEASQLASVSSYFRGTVYPSGTMTWEGNSAPVSQSISVTYSNRSKESVQKVFYYSTIASVSLGVTSVPEPGTWGLMGLGLIGLLLAVRQNQKH